MRPLLLLAHEIAARTRDVEAMGATPQTAGPTPTTWRGVPVPNNPGLVGLTLVSQLGDADFAVRMIAFDMDAGLVRQQLDRLRFRLE